MNELLSHTDAQKTGIQRRYSRAAFGFGMIAGLLLAALFVSRQVAPEPELPGSNSSLSETVLLLEQAMQHVSNDYINEISPDELAKAALQGIFTTLDKHSKYLDENSYQHLLEQTDGEYLGIGIEVNEQDDYVTIISLVENSPAEQIGLLNGDRIIAINGQSLAGTSYKDLLGQLRQNSNAVIALTIKRLELSFDVQLNRDFIPIHSVASVLIPLSEFDEKTAHDDVGQAGIAYIRISHFNDHTADDLALTLDDLKNNPQPVYGLVLDLRNNPGGLLNAAVAVSDLFLSSGTIVSANGRAMDADFKYHAHAGEKLAGLPLIVLINHATASAAEIVAAALKEQDRATIIGQNSFGKGLVQTIIPLREGALKLTTSRYYTPSGLSINDRGIQPHIKIEDSAMMMAVQEMNEIKKLALPHHLAIKDPALLRAWQHLNRMKARDQLAMDMHDAE